MKATLYTLPSKQLLVFTDEQGRVVAIDHPITEYGALALAQDKGVGFLNHRDIKDLLGLAKPGIKKPVA